MKRLILNVTEATLTNLVLLARLCNDSTEDFGGTSHGKLTVLRLLEMLIEDASLAVDRPGSWEGSSVRELMQKHGYGL